MSQTVERQRHGTKDNGGSKDTTVGALVHALGLLTLIGPLIVYLLTDDPFVKKNAANATNWQISMVIWTIISVALSIVIIGFIGLMLLPVLDLVFCLVAAVKAADGETWDYPLTIDML